MDVFGVITIPSYLLVGLVFLLSLYMYGRRTFGYFKALGIDGPSPIAFLGNLYELNKLGFHLTLRHWKEKYGETYGFFFGPHPNIVIHDPEIIEVVLVKDFANFTNRPIPFDLDEITGSMLTIVKDGRWKYLRTVLAPSYSSRQLRAMIPLVEKGLRTFEKNIDKMADGGEAHDVTQLFSGYTMNVIAATGFGVDVNSQEDPNNPLIKNARAIFRTNIFQDGLTLVTLFPFLMTIIVKLNLMHLVLGKQVYFHKFCKGILDERKKNKDKSPHKSLLQLMLDAQVEGNEKLDSVDEKELGLENMADWRNKRGITDAEIIAQCTLFFLAGFETTSTTLSFFTHSIAVNPDVQEKLYKEIMSVLGEESPNYDNVQKLPYLEMCMAETLRKYPILTQLQRESKKERTIKGVKFPENVSVAIPVVSLHYDPKYWPEPNKFDPERFSEKGKAKQTPFTYLPFGAGPRICAGMRLARLEFKMAVVQMLRKFRVVPTEKTEDPIVFGKTELLSPKNGIWLKIEHR